MENLPENSRKPFEPLQQMQVTVCFWSLLTFLDLPLFWGSIHFWGGDEKTLRIKLQLSLKCWIVFALLMSLYLLFFQMKPANFGVFFTSPCNKFCWNWGWPIFTTVTRNQSLETNWFYWRHQKFYDADFVTLTVPPLESHKAVLKFKLPSSAQAKPAGAEIALLPANRAPRPLIG